MTDSDKLVLCGWLMTNIQDMNLKVYRGNSALRAESDETILLTKALNMVRKGVRTLVKRWCWLTFQASIRMHIQTILKGIH